MQINPDEERINKAIHEHAMFQSYQFMQINPDLADIINAPKKAESFNRINSCRSIPTLEIAIMAKSTYIVSIVSIHADQSRPVCS